MMKRSALYGILFFFLILASALVAGAVPTLVQTTKHNLSSSGTFSVKTSSGESEICVFCHTPHSARADAPLWNRTNVGGGYTTYTSDVLSALTLVPEDPVTGVNSAIHVKTRICLSCHDGTIALGSLVNLPQGFGGGIPITGPGIVGGKMTSGTAGFIGQDLRGDHPVAVKHDSTIDTELIFPILTSKARVYKPSGSFIIADNITNGNWVECTSCHDAHDNEYTNFLIDSNLASKICTSCHAKRTGGVTSAHDSASTLYDPNGNGVDGSKGIGNTVGNVKCMNCHYPHRAGATGTTAPFTANPASGEYLLSFQEDNACFNNAPNQNRWGRTLNVCHGAGSPTVNAGNRSIDIQSQMSGAKLTYSAHSANKNAAYSGKHGAMEQGVNTVPPSVPKIAVAHVVCSDCHNAHTAGNGALHTAGTNTINNNSALYGAGGVQFSSPIGWSVPAAGLYTGFEPLGATSSSSVPGSYYEYQICLKCHSSFSVMPSGTDLTGIANMTDQAKEFNTGNVAYHTVIGARSAGSYPIPAASWNAGSGFSNTSTMYCSDCHGNDSASPSPQGPHGSTNAGILVKPFTDAYNTITSNSQPTGELCNQCHTDVVYNGTPSNNDTTNSGTAFLSSAPGTGINLHNYHKWAATNSGISTYAYRCVNCHVRIPHGYPRRGMIVVSTDAGGSGDASVYATGGSAGAKITVFPPSAIQSYGTTTAGSGCTTVAGCHH